MRYLLPLSVLWCAVWSYGQPMVADFISQQDVSQILHYLSSDELEGRDQSKGGIQKAATYITDYFTQNKVQSYFETYRHPFVLDGIEGINIIGSIEGNDPELAKEFILISAHYDHIGTAREVNGDTIANGANDNATGTTAVMLLAKYFAEHKSNKRSLLFVLFDAEEKGLLGSKALAKELKEKDLNLYAVVNFEMIGVPMEDKSYTVYSTGYRKSNFAERFNAYLGSEWVGFLPKAEEYLLFKRSDNYPFYEEFKVPAHTFSTFDFSNYEYYHHVDDEFEHMNTEFMARIIEKSAVGLEKMSATTEKEIQLNAE